ncbi:MAG: Uma2 family endonuclease [Verrucomicrobia bacterium]|nr:Uma2 family endonuclease [Verrucomicrobiota bacterium]
MSETAKQGRRHTWADYQTWNDDQRWEIIGGEAHLMSPAPTWRHQGIIGELHAQMQPYFKGKKCKLGLSPLDVVLSDDDVVQPDLLVVCEPNKVKRTHVEGAPTLAVEVLSPRSGSLDRLLKLNLYARAGVKEYWLVTPWPSLVEVLLLKGGRYVVHGVFGKHDTLLSPTFPDLKIQLSSVFDFPLEPGEEPPVVKEPPAPGYRAVKS